MLFFALSMLALVSGNDEYRYSSLSEDTLCYGGGDECRASQICDMGSYICADPTPSGSITNSR